MKKEEINSRFKKFEFVIRTEEKNINIYKEYNIECSKNHLFLRKPCNIIYNRWNVYCPECKKDIEKQKLNEKYIKIKKEFKKRGLKLISEIYKKQSDSCEVECSCGKRFFTKYHSILYKNKKFFCPDCPNNKVVSFEEASKNFENLRVNLLIDKQTYKNAITKCRMYCIECNKTYIKKYSDVIKSIKNNKGHCLHLECGCYKTDLTDKKFNELTVISNNRKHIKDSYYEECRCSCDKICYVSRTELICGIRKCCDKNHMTRILNKKMKDFLKKQNILMLSEFKGFRKNKIKIKCSCNKIFYISSSNLNFYRKNKKKLLCQHHYVNGVLTSKKALELHSYLTNFGVHNFKSKSKQSIDIAFSYRGKKIAIEYDEWFWHKNKKNIDIKKTKQLIKEGWVVLRILAHNDLPKKNVVYKILDYIIDNNKKYRLLKSKNWKGYD